MIYKYENNKIIYIYNKTIYRQTINKLKIANLYIISIYNDNYFTYNTELKKSRELEENINYVRIIAKLYINKYKL